MARAPDKAPAGKAKAPAGKAKAPAGKAKAPAGKAKAPATLTPLQRVRALAYQHPAVEEKLSHGSPAWFVRGKQLAAFVGEAYGEGVAIWVKSDLARQAELVAASPARYFIPKYVGVKGWVGVRVLDETDWEELGLLIEAAWDQVAPASAREAPVLPPPANAAAEPVTTDRALAEAVLAKVAAICLALPETEQQDEGHHASFRVRGKAYAQFLDNHHGDGIIAVCVKAPDGEHERLAASDPKRFYLPAYIGPRGWVGVRLDTARVDWADVAARLEASHTLVAPKRPRRT